METIVLLFLAICVLTVAAQRLKVSQPILFLFGGLLLGYIPGVHAPQIPPELILPLFLPPILMEAAYFTSLRDFRYSIVAIMQLAIGLVILTTLIVGFAADALIGGLGIAAAVVLGAIISPPDAVAATSTVKHLNLPKRVVTILEGESLINDATSLVLYQFAVLALVTGGFSLADASLQFLWMVVGGVGIGLGMAFIYTRFYRYIRESSIEILSTFVMPYLAFFAAEQLHASGVLAIVVAGLYVTWHGPRLFSPTFRIPAEAIWKMVVFVMNAAIFILIGWQTPELLGRLNGYDPISLIGYALAVCVTIVAIRFVWVFTAAYGFRVLFPRWQRREPYPAWQNVFIIAWTGMRGVVSLATALALPYTLADGTPFEHRDLIIFLSLSVIFFTLAVQGLTLPWLLRKLQLHYNAQLVQEEWQARVYAVESALIRINDLANDPNIHQPAIERIRSHYMDKRAALGDGPNTPLYPSERAAATDHHAIVSENHIWQEVLERERESVVALRRAFTIGDDTMHEILREVDLLSTRYSRA